MIEILAILAIYFGFGSSATPHVAAEPPEIFEVAEPPQIFGIAQPPEIF